MTSISTTADNPAIRYFGKEIVVLWFKGLIISIGAWSSDLRLDIGIIEGPVVGVLITAPNSSFSGCSLVSAV